MPFLLLFLLATVLAPALAWEKRVDTHGKTIIAYYASWQWYDRKGLAAPSNLDHSKVTRYNFAFFQINESGAIWGTDNWADSNVLHGPIAWNGGGEEKCSWDSPTRRQSCNSHNTEAGLIKQAHDAGVEVYPSIGGWTLSDPFPAMAADPDARQRFAANCVDLIEAYDFDGIDIDWEYPGYVDHKGTPQDTVNFSLLLGDMRDALDGLEARTGREYGLTAALPCGPDLIDNIQVDVVSDILTELNLMTYDFHGTWNANTGVNAPLFDMTGSPNLSVHGCVENWRLRGGSPDQINLGIPFYGRSFAGPALTEMNQPHCGKADLISWPDDSGTPQYYNIADKLDQFTSVRHDQTRTQYAHNDVGLVSYDDERSVCDKTEYAMDTGLGGYIIWEISGDLLSDLSTPLLDAMDDRLNNAEIRCSSSSVDPTVPIDNGELYYPRYDENRVLVECRNDGLAPVWISSYMMKPSKYECCESYFPGSVDECVADNLFYPDLEAALCLNDGMQPDWMVGDYLSEERWRCCEMFFKNNASLLQQCNGIEEAALVPRSLQVAPPCPAPSTGVILTSNYCGSDWGDANAKCTTACPGGVDSECPDGEKCYADCANCVGSTTGGGGGPAPAPAQGSNFCGTNWGDANSKCTTPCPGGVDAECPSGERCYADCTNCAGGGGGGTTTNPGPVSGTTNYCGNNWGDANSKCTTPCPGGVDAECPSGERCYADCANCAGGGGVGTVSALGLGGNYCGSNWGDANSKCMAPCPGGVDRECPAGEKCYADLSGCSGGGGTTTNVGTVSASGLGGNYCGSNWGDANSKCMTPCPGGVDRECPAGEKCYADISGCSGDGITTTNAGTVSASGLGGNYCGSNWGDANSRCMTPCPGGVDRECPAGEQCYADLSGCSGGGG